MNVHYLCDSKNIFDLNKNRCFYDINNLSFLEESELFKLYNQLFGVKSSTEKCFNYYALFILSDREVHSRTHLKSTDFKSKINFSRDLSNFYVRVDFENFIPTTMSILT